MLTPNCYHDTLLELMAPEKAGTGSKFRLKTCIKFPKRKRCSVYQKVSILNTGHLEWISE